MKKFYLFFFICIFFFGKISFSQKNILLPVDLIINERIPLDSTHYKNMPTYSEFYKNLYLSVENTKIKYHEIFEKCVSSRKIKAFSTYSPYQTDFSEPLSISDIEEKMGLEIDTIIGYENEQSIVYTQPDFSEITGIYFFDKWIFDVDKFTFQKLNIAYSPIRKYYRPDDEDQVDPKYKLISFFIFPKNKGKISKKMKLLKKIEYEFLIGNIEVASNPELANLGLNFEKENSPFWSSYSREIFITSIINKAISQEIPAYKFHTNYKLSKSEIEQSLGVRVDTIMNDEGQNIIFNTPYNLSEIQSVIFIEEWYVDTETLFIGKKIIGVAPVRTYFRSVNLVPIKSIPFIIYFNQNY